MQKIQNYINGELKAPSSNKYLDNYNPAIGEVYSLIPDSGAEDVHEAVEAGQGSGWTDGVRIQKKKAVAAGLTKRKVVAFAETEISSRLDDANFGKFIAQHTDRSIIRRVVDDQDFGSQALGGRRQ